MVTMVTLTINAPQDLQQQHCDNAFARFRTNPALGFTRASEIALGIKPDNFTNDRQPLTQRKHRFLLAHTVMQEIVDKDCFNFMANQRTSHINADDKKEIIALFRQGDLIGVVDYLTQKCEAVIKVLVDAFDFRHSNIVRFYESTYPETYDEEKSQLFADRLKFRVVDGIENMMQRFFELTTVSMNHAAKKYQHNLNALQSLLKNNLRFFSSIARMRFDVFNHLAKTFLIPLYHQEDDELMQEYWQIHSYTDPLGKNVDMIAPTDKLFKDLIEAYPYADTAAVLQEGSEDGKSCPSFGCPAIKVEFPNKLGNMLEVFYRWYLKTLDDYFFTPLRNIQLKS